MRELEKRCNYCHSSYRPDPRTASFQKSCSDPACRRKRKQEAQAKFLKDNPGHFRGRYCQIKPWLAAHPGYLADYRAAHPDYREKNRLRERLRRRRRKWFPVDIQVAMVRRQVQVLRDLRGVDIQDTMKRQLDGLLGILGRDPRVDIQVQNDVSAPTP